MTRILVVEDNVRFAALLKEHLGDAGYVVDVASTVREFKDLASRNEHALYLIDLGLPDGDGLDIIADLRAANSQTPILVATARAASDERVIGLDCGADDYLVKPFNHPELLARVRALLRRPSELAPDSLLAGKLILDCKTGAVTCEGKRIVLHPSEQGMLLRLIRRAGCVL